MTSDPTQRKGSDNQDGIHYSSVQFKRSQTKKEAPPPTSTLPLYIVNDQDVQYAAVNFSRERGRIPWQVGGVESRLVLVRTEVSVMSVLLLLVQKLLIIIIPEIAAGLGERDAHYDLLLLSERER